MRIYFSKDSHHLLFEQGALYKHENGLLVINFESIKHILYPDNTKCFISYCMVTRLGFGFRTSSMINGDNLVLEISTEKDEIHIMSKRIKRRLFRKDQIEIVMNQRIFSDISIMIVVDDAEGNPHGYDKIISFIVIEGKDEDLGYEEYISLGI